VDLVLTALLSTAALCAGIYLVAYVNAPATMTRALVKTASVASLSLFATYAGGPWLLVLGLGFSALGDYLLARDGDRAFLAGMLAFFTAHIAYILLFATLLSPTGTPFSVGLGGIVLLVLGAGLYAFLWPRLGAFRVPVFLYTLAIVAMGSVALAFPLRAPGGLILVGALWFMLSDSVLAWEKFRPPPHARLRRALPGLVWVTYWGAQVMILFGGIGWMHGFPLFL